EQIAVHDSECRRRFVTLLQRALEPRHGGAELALSRLGPQLLEAAIELHHPETRLGRAFEVLSGQVDPRQCAAHLPRVFGRHPSLAQELTVYPREHGDRFARVFRHELRRTQATRAQRAWRQDAVAMEVIEQERLALGGGPALLFVDAKESAAA